jgi:hypothetical protein
VVVLRLLGNWRGLMMNHQRFRDCEQVVRKAFIQSVMLARLSCQEANCYAQSFV